MFKILKNITKAFLCSSKVSQGRIRFFTKIYVGFIFNKGMPLRMGKMTTPSVSVILNHLFGGQYKTKMAGLFSSWLLKKKEKFWNSLERASAYNEVDTYLE